MSQRSEEIALVRILRYTPRMVVFSIVSLLILALSTGCGVEESAEHEEISGRKEACTKEWEKEWVVLEDEVLKLVNEARAAGGICVGEGTSEEFASVPPLQQDSALRCAARYHSKDMAERGFFDHVNPSGESAADRVNATGYPWVRLGENIALGHSTPRAVVNAWLSSFGHCRNLLEPQFTDLGVGFYDSGNTHNGTTSRGLYWTQKFGTTGD